MKKKRICVTVPVYNASDELKACVKSLLKKLDFSLAEVIIADDFSQEETRNYIKSVAAKYPDKFRAEMGEERKKERTAAIC